MTPRVLGLDGFHLGMREAGHCRWLAYWLLYSPYKPTWNRFGVFKLYVPHLLFLFTFFILALELGWFGTACWL
jgi:hypothetical protein